MVDIAELLVYLQQLLKLVFLLRRGSEKGQSKASVLVGFGDTRRMLISTQAKLTSNGKLRAYQSVSTPVRRNQGLRILDIKLEHSC